MAKTIREMVETGVRKFARKKDRMEKRWYARTSDMKRSFGDLPFGDTIKEAYNEGIDAAVRDKAYRVDADKWARNWEGKVTK